MSEHLPWVNHLAAREAGVGLIEFSQLAPAEQREWIRFTLLGPSRFRDTLMIAEIRNLFVDFLTRSKTLSPVDEEWLDGVLDHPEAAWERRVAETRAKRKAERVAASKALHERESAANK